MAHAAERTRGVFSLGSSLGFASLVSLLAASVAPAQVTFTVTDPGLPPDFPVFYTAGSGGLKLVNNAGQFTCVAERYHDQGDQAANRPPVREIAVFRYTPGVGFENLSAGHGLRWSSVQAINERGDVFGSAHQETFYWDPNSGLAEITRDQWSLWKYTQAGGAVLLDVPPIVVDNYTVFLSPGMFNDSAQAVFHSTDGNPFGLTYDGAGRVVNTTYEELSALHPSLATGVVAEPRAINNAGQILGKVQFTGQAFIYSDAAGLELIPDPGQPGQTHPQAITESGDAFGNFVAADGQWHWFHKPAGQPIVDRHDTTRSPGAQIQLAMNGYVFGQYMSSPSRSSVTGYFRWDPQNGYVDLDVPTVSFPPYFDQVAIFNSTSGTIFGNAIGPQNEPWLWTPSEGYRTIQDIIDPDRLTYDVLGGVGMTDGGTIVVQVRYESGPSGLRFLILTPGASCPADFDAQNGVQVADIFAFLRAWFANQPSADFDQMNGIQVADIFAFLRAWFAGC